jgi:hypothetical protein
MKLQCSCGAKYAFDATPDMLNNPVKFICPNCGLDASDFVNQLIRQEFGGATPPPAPAATPPPPPPPRASGLRVAHEAAPAPAAEAAEPSKFCAKHRERATEQCAVCHKPICPKCLEMFGFFCSPLCKGKADAQHINVPTFAGRKDLVEAKFWRKVGLAIGGLVAALAVFFGVWTWYAWFGSVPHPYFSVRFEDDNRAYHGTSFLAGQDQIVFLHGGTLARYDLKTKKAVWTRELISNDRVEAALKDAQAEEARENEGMGYKTHQNAEDTRREIIQDLQSELTLRVSGQNIWVDDGTKLTRYDWDTGQAGRGVILPETGNALVQSGDELQAIGPESVTHINLASGDSRVDRFGPAEGKTVPLSQTPAGAGLPGAATGAGTRALDPQKVEAQAQNLNLQGRIALPALLSNARYEEQLEDALREGAQRPQPKSQAPPADAAYFLLVPGDNGFVEFGFRMVEEHIVKRSAMKAPPKKSVLDGNLNAAQTDAAANEILNDMQRNAGGDTVTEDQSRYQVIVHLPDASAPDWSGEVTGPPQLFVLKSVNVVAAGTGLIVLDKSNKKIWEATLTYFIPFNGGMFSRATLHYGNGPCVEHGNTLYVFDQAVLTSFDLQSGNARWRLPSVGVVGLFFDGKDNVYVNTTTGNPDDIKYSRQIDLSRRTEAVVSKVDPKAGKTLWSVKPCGFVSYLSGKFIYVIDCYDPNPTDHEVLNDMTASLQKPAYLRIARLRPSDGKMMWEYYDRNRCPVNWRFNDNSIELVFKREVQVLRYLTF